MRLVDYRRTCRNVDSGLDSSAFLVGWFSIDLRHRIRLADDAAASC